MIAGSATHEEMACQLLSAVDDYDTTDEWSLRRKEQVIAEANAHAVLAVVSAVNRFTKAVEKSGQAAPSKGSWL